MKRAASSARTRRPPLRGASDTIHAFRADALRAGDILLSSVPFAAASIAIRIATASRFSHAAICTDPPFFVEASAPARAHSRSAASASKTRSGSR